MPSSKAPERPRAHSRGAHGTGAGGGDGAGESGGGGGGGGGGGDLVKVAFARTQAEAELIQGLLSEAGIPSVLKRSIPLYGMPYMPGPSNVMVAAAAAPRAKEMLRDTFGETEEEEWARVEAEARAARGEGAIVSPVRLGAWVLAAAIGAVALIWVLYELS
jgi:hypothetical protein